MVGPVLGSQLLLIAQTVQVKPIMLSLPQAPVPVCQPKVPPHPNLRESSRAQRNRSCQRVVASTIHRPSQYTKMRDFPASLRSFHNARLGCISPDAAAKCRIRFTHRTAYFGPEQTEFLLGWLGSYGTRGAAVEREACRIGNGLHGFARVHRYQGSEPPHARGQSGRRIFRSPAPGRGLGGRRLAEILPEPRLYRPAARAPAASAPPGTGSCAAPSCT